MPLDGPAPPYIFDGLLLMLRSTPLPFSSGRGQVGRWARRRWLGGSMPPLVGHRRCFRSCGRQAGGTHGTTRPEQSRHCPPAVRLGPYQNHSPQRAGAITITTARGRTSSRAARRGEAVPTTQAPVASRVAPSGTRSDHPPISGSSPGHAPGRFLMPVSAGSARLASPSGASP